MPHDLAAIRREVFHYGAIISPPNDWDRWERLSATSPTTSSSATGSTRSAVGLRDLERGEPGGVLVRHPRRVPAALRLSVGRSRRSTRSCPSAGRRPPRRPGSTSRSTASPSRRRRSTSCRPTPTGTRRSTSVRSPPATAAPACRCGGPNGAPTPPTSTAPTTPSSAAYLARGMVSAMGGSTPSRTGPCPTTSRSSATAPSCSTAGSGCSPSATCASRAGGRCGCSNSSPTGSSRSVSTATAPGHGQRRGVGRDRVVASCGTAPSTSRSRAVKRCSTVRGVVRSPTSTGRGTLRHRRLDAEHSNINGVWGANGRRSAVAERGRDMEADLAAARTSSPTTTSVADVRPEGGEAHLRVRPPDASGLPDRAHPDLNGVVSAASRRRSSVSARRSDRATSNSSCSPALPGSEHVERAPDHDGVAERRHERRRRRAAVCRTSCSPARCGWPC